MSQFGWGFIATLADPSDRPFLSGMRWDVPGTQWYDFRPDRSIPAAVDFFLEGGIIPAYQQIIESHRSGAPVESSPPSTSPMPPRRRSESRKSGTITSAHGFRSGKAPTARGKCPKGHYWSYKHKKCMKSKF